MSDRQVTLSNTPGGPTPPSAGEPYVDLRSLEYGASVSKGTVNTLTLEFAVCNYDIWGMFGIELVEEVTKTLAHHVMGEVSDKDRGRFEDLLSELLRGYYNRILWEDDETGPPTMWDDRYGTEDDG